MPVYRTFVAVAEVSDITLTRRIPLRQDQAIESYYNFTVSNIHIAALCSISQAVAAYTVEMFQLPPEVYSAIASHLSKSDLLTLSYTSKAFQRAAEPRIYESVHLRDPHVAIASFFPLLKNDAFRAPYVKRFLLYEDPRFSDPRRSLVTCPPQFWHSVQLVLKRLVNLDYLVIHDPQLARSWLLDDHEVRFQLREANLRLPWDASLVAFLEGQQRLQRLILSGGVVDDRVLPSLSPNALPKLEVFSGSVLVTPEVLGCPLTRLQMTVDESTVLVLHTVVADIGKNVRTLRKLNILGMPEELCMSIVKTISTAVFAPVLRYLGVLTIPPPARDVSSPFLFPRWRVDIVRGSSASASRVYGRTRITS